MSATTLSCQAKDSGHVGHRAFSLSSFLFLCEEMSGVFDASSEVSVGAMTVQACKRKITVQERLH
jgi:hypothetical protein